MAAVRSTPWAERHRPKHLGEVIGNTDQVRKLAEWLRDWDDVVLHGKVKEAPAAEAWMKFAPAPDNINARAALVSGPPGIGKTTTCVLLAKCSPKYSVMEYNASDARGKAIIDQMSGSLAGNHTLRFGSGGKTGAGSALERVVIIMDECDGMTGGDKGGVQAMMNMIKITKNPIICICNDRGDAQVRNLATICYDIKFKRPDNALVAKRIKKVMENEGKTVDLHTIESVIEACGQDIRHIINQSQFFGSVNAHGKETQKDTQVMLNPFDACEKFLALKGPKLPTMERRMDMFYLDSEMMPLMVQENYLKTYEKRRRSDDRDVENCARAAELIALGDTFSGNWEVAGSAAVIGTVYPAFLAADESFKRPSFPAWLQKKAPTSKADRMKQDTHARVKKVTSCSCSGLVTSNYLDVLYRRLLKPLSYGAVKEVAEALFALALPKEFFTEWAPALRGPLQLEDGYKRVDGKVKYAMNQELTNLAKAAEPVHVKRKREAVKKSRGEDAMDDGGNEAEDGGDAGKKRKTMVKKPKSTAASSLAGWRPVKTVHDTQGNVITDSQQHKRDPLMIMKYLDGHTCAVRRTVHMKDILEPWLLF